MTTRELLRSLAESLADALEAKAPESDYYDQTNSPLPRATYLKLVRRGALPGYRCHGRVFVRRDDLRAYIERHRVEPPDTSGQSPEDEEQAELNRLLGQRSN